MDLTRVTDELASTKAECERLETEQPVLAQKFRYYQELRGYVTDLVECLDEKVGSYISFNTGGRLRGSGQLVATYGA
jgi:GC-rich sequence DNA-binding factor